MTFTKQPSQSSSQVQKEQTSTLSLTVWVSNQTLSLFSITQKRRKKNFWSQLKSFNIKFSAENTGKALRLCFEIFSDN